MNYNISPREEYIRDPERIKDHHVLVENPVLRHAINAALLQYQRIQTDARPPEMGSCAASFLKLQGAQELVALLYNFTEQFEIRPRDNGDNLATNVRPAAAKR